MNAVQLSLPIEHTNFEEIFIDQNKFDNNRVPILSYIICKEVGVAVVENGLMMSNLSFVIIIKYLTYMI